MSSLIIGYVLAPRRCYFHCAHWDLVLRTLLCNLPSSGRRTQGVGLPTPSLLHLPLRGNISLQSAAAS